MDEVHLDPQKGGRNGLPRPLPRKSYTSALRKSPLPLARSDGFMTARRRLRCGLKTAKFTDPSSQRHQIMLVLTKPKSI